MYVCDCVVKSCSFGKIILGPYLGILRFKPFQSFIYFIIILKTFFLMLIWIDFKTIHVFVI